MSQQNMYTKRKIASKKQNLEQKCVLHLVKPRDVGRDLFCLSREVTA